MIQQHLAGELSVLLGHLQTAASTEASRRDAWLLRHVAETQPVTVLGSVTTAAIALTERLCWDSLTRVIAGVLIGGLPVVRYSGALTEGS